MQAIGHPLFNDPEYGGTKIPRTGLSGEQRSWIGKAFQCIPGQALHAKTLGFLHPDTEEFLRFETELPEFFAALLKIWQAPCFGY